jgi:PAS domain S-box-containing protein
MFADKNRSNAEEGSALRSERDEIAEIAAIQAVVSSDKRTEESALQSAIDTCKDGILIGDLWGYIRYVNQALLKMIGMSDASECIGKHVLNFLPKEDRNRETVEALNSIVTNQGRKRIYRILSMKGEEFLLEVTVDFLRDENGEKIGFVDLIRDISNGKRSEN